MPASFIRTLEDFAAQHDLGIYDPSSGAIQIGLLDNGLDPLVTAIGFEGSQVPQGWIEGEYFVAEVLAEYGLGAPPSLVRPAEQSFSALDSLAALAGNGEWQGPVKPTTAHFDQRFIHGILSNSNFALEAWVRSLGGDPGDRLDWRSDAAYTMHQRWMFEREARRLAYSVIESRREAGEARPLLLHGHSAGGVMASEVARILTEEGIPIAGMVTYGTPRDRLRFFTGIPPKLPVLALENQGDEILYLDGAGPNKAPNVRVVSFPDSVSVGAFDHPMADYTLDPNVNREVNQFAGSLLGSQKLGADTGPELSPARLKPQPNLTSGSLREVGGIVSRLVVEGQAAAPELANVALGDVMESWRRTGIGWVGLTGIVSDITVFNSETVVRLQTALGVDGVVQETPFGLSMSRGVNLLARIPAVAIKDRYFIDLPELDAESLESMDWEWK
ncbi:MAG: thioesterase domain-containing protein [Cyanobacteria bacterium J06648_11]